MQSNLQFNIQCATPRIKFLLTVISFLLLVNLCHVPIVMAFPDFNKDENNGKDGKERNDGKNGSSDHFLEEGDFNHFIKTEKKFSINFKNWDPHETIFQGS